MSGAMRRLLALRRVSAAAPRDLRSLRAVAVPLARVGAGSVRMLAEETKEAASATPQSFEFQAETRQLLDIVTHSLYTDREVFLRELVSNASDALEKLRHRQRAGADVVEPDRELCIELTLDEAAKTITLSDGGIGMTESEMRENLGTIARSGSKAFVSAAEGGEAASNIIGQFGVGFYAAFMVAEEVTVASRPADPAAASMIWKSTGAGSYSIEAPAADAAPVPRGCTLTLKLKEDAAEFVRKSRVEDIIRRYSNFVNFPIKLNGEVVNTVQAVWTKAEKDVTEDQYTDFYRYVAGAFDAPMSRLHFRTDAPLDIQALLFVPGSNSEQFGMGRMEPGVSLYSRKVLIEHRSPDILPEWLRFLRGVVDSEDLPLSISREKAQDSRLVANIRDVMTKRIIRFFGDMKKREPETYGKFYAEYASFLKEGICQDFLHQEQLSKLLMFESSKEAVGKLITFDDYISRCAPEQTQIFFLCAPTRELAEESPYFEAFRKADREVLFVYNAIDDFVMTNLGQFSGRRLVSAETGDLDLKTDKTDAADEAKDTEAEADPAVDADMTALCDWLKTTALKGKVNEVKVTDRLESTPAIVTSNESGALRAMMRMVDQQRSGKAAPLPPQCLELNSKHELVRGLLRIKDEKPELAQLVAEQLFDNALVTAGLLEDGRPMVPRLNKLLAHVL